MRKTRRKELSRSSSSWKYERSDFIRELEDAGCVLHRHGSKHDIYRNPLRFEEIKDGTSHTAMLVESHDAGVVWTEPRDLDAATMRAKAIYAAATPPAKQGPSSPHAAQRSVTYFSDLNRPHPSGAHMAMADGSVRFVSENVDPEVVKQLNRRDGGP